MDELVLHGLLQRARSFADERRWLHAVQVYRSILDQDPTCDDAWIELASAYSALGKADAAESLLMDRAASAETPEPYLFILGSLMYRAGRNADAYRHFVRVLRVEETLDTRIRARLHFMVGAIFGDQRKWSVAEHHFRTVLNVDPTFPRIHESLAEVLLHRGATEDADVHIQKAITEDPLSWTAQFVRGLIGQRRRHWDAALDAFVHAVDIDPKEPRGWQKCGECLLTLKRLEESEQYLRKALELNPTMTDALVDFAHLAIERGDRQAAEALFERALDLDPGHRRALAGARSLDRNSTGRGRS